MPRPQSCSFSSTRLAHTDVVSTSSATSNNFTTEFSSTANITCATTETCCSSSFVEQTKINSCRNQYEGLKFLSTTEKILKNSIRDNTEKKYNVYWSQFVTYCEEQNIDINNVNIHQILDFLSKLFDRNLSISVIRAAKNAIAQHIHIPPYKKLSEHPLMNKYFKGLFNLRPPKQKFGVCMGCEYNI